MNFCPGFIPEEDSYAIMNRALELEINFFDCANIYGDYYSPEGVGGLESILGQWLKQEPSRRD